MWANLDYNEATIDEAVEPLLKRTDQFDRVWSIAELRLDEKDVAWLKKWFGSLSPQTIYEHCCSLTQQYKFGALLICAAAEECREHSTEGSVWPSVRTLLPHKSLWQVNLFLPNGQPSESTKYLIEDAVRILNLRHAMDLEGTQQWFSTIKLQFGFTFKGARNRLAEWLVGLGRPHTLDYLEGYSEVPELACDSFKTLWQALAQYRRGLITEERVRDSIYNNPWIKPHWIEVLLKEAKARISTLGTGEYSEDLGDLAGEDAAAEEFCPVLSTGLDWPPNGTPRIVLRLDKLAIENEVKGVEIGELDFYIDGRKIVRWLRQRDGSWSGKEDIYAEPESCVQQPNLSPSTIMVQSRVGHVVAQAELSEVGISEEVLIFDLDANSSLRPGFDMLRADRNYAILCDCNADFKGVEIAEKYTGENRKALRLAPPIPEDLCVTYKDFLLWQPVTEAKAIDKRPSLVLSIPRDVEYVDLNAKSVLCLEGLPESAANVHLLMRNKVYELIRQDQGWYTDKEIKITPQLESGQKRLRIKYELNDRKHTQKPRLSLMLRGMALRNLNGNPQTADEFTVIQKGEELNRSQGVTYLNIWVPEVETKAVAIEGDCMVGKLRYDRIRLRDLPGHGGEISVCGEELQHDFGVNCLDRGRIQSFLPAILTNGAHISFSIETDPNEIGEEGYGIHQLSCKTNGSLNLEKIPDENITSRSKPLQWEVLGINDPGAIALTWKGCWLGAWWNIQKIAAIIQEYKQLKQKDFALLKWFRFPVLKEAIYEPLQTAIVNNPGRFLRAWLDDESLPESLKPHPHIEGIYAVIRAFLWNEFPIRKAYDVISLIEHRDTMTNQRDGVLLDLATLTEISPIVAWKQMSDISMRVHDNQLIKEFIFYQSNLPAHASRGYIKHRKNQLLERAARATSMGEGIIRLLVKKRIDGCKSNKWHPENKNARDMLKLSESKEGRKYLSLQMAEEWI